MNCFDNKYYPRNDIPVEYLERPIDSLPVLRKSNLSATASKYNEYPGSFQEKEDKHIPGDL